MPFPLRRARKRTFHLRLSVPGLLHLEFAAEVGFIEVHNSSGRCNVALSIIHAASTVLYADNSPKPATLLRMAVDTTITEKEANLQHVEKVESDSSNNSSSDQVEKHGVVAGKDSSAHRVEKLGGLRIDGDDLDHEHEPKVCHPILGCNPGTNVIPQMSFRRFMSLLAMALLWTGSQIPLYLWGRSIYRT